MTPEEAEYLKKTRMGFIVSNILFTNSPRVYKTAPSFLGVEMWTQGASQKLITVTNKLGASLSASASRSAVDNIAKGYRFGMDEWKQKMEEVPILQT